jgi:hypothetical protein
MSSSTAGLIPRGKHTITVDGVRQVFHVSGTGPLCLAHPGGPGFGWEYLPMPAPEQHLSNLQLFPRQHPDQQEASGMSGAYQATLAAQDDETCMTRSPDLS